MSDRADFKDSIRRLAAQVMSRDEADSKGRITRATKEPLRKPALIKSADEPQPSAPARPNNKRTKRPSVLEWLKQKADFKQVSVEFPRELDEMITRASHGQRMMGKFPGRKRELLNVAAAEWLERNGWFRPEELNNQGSEDQENDANT
jgi:hypothetical protein